VSGLPAAKDVPAGGNSRQSEWHGTFETLKDFEEVDMADCVTSAFNLPHQMLCRVSGDECHIGWANKAGKVSTWPKHSDELPKW
jgi:hypothetical protein